MSNLRRMVLSDRFFFITCRVYRPRRKLSGAELAVLAEVVRELREAHRFLLAVNAPSGKGSSIPEDRILMPSDERRRI